MMYNDFLMEDKHKVAFEASLLKVLQKFNLSNSSPYYNFNKETVSLYYDSKYSEVFSVYVGNGVLGIQFQSYPNNCGLLICHSIGFSFNIYRDNKENFKEVWDLVVDLGKRMGYSHFQYTTATGQDILENEMLPAFGFTPHYKFLNDRSENTVTVWGLNFNTEKDDEENEDEDF